MKKVSARTHVANRQRTRAARTVRIKAVFEDAIVGNGENVRVTVDAFGQRNTELDALAARLAHELVGDLRRVNGPAAVSSLRRHPHMLKCFKAQEKVVKCRWTQVCKDDVPKEKAVQADGRRSLDEYLRDFFRQFFGRAQLRRSDFYKVRINFAEFCRIKIGSFATKNASLRLK